MRRNIPVATLLALMGVLAGCGSKPKSPQALQQQEAAEAQLFHDWFAVNGHMDAKGQLTGAPFVSRPERCDDPEAPAMLTEFYMRLPQALIDDFLASNPPGTPPVRLSTPQGSVLVADAKPADNAHFRSYVSRVGFNAAQDEALLCMGGTFVFLQKTGSWKPVKYIEASQLIRLSTQPL
jgi:hypothetical protein